ncbi:MAG TPA: hypothetical protein VEW25_04590 [Allosphingosinicella sp.]|nr:hypothetical protein [Allosphingosinicella sp.]
MKPVAAAFSLILLAACARTEDASVRPAESNDSYSAVEQVRDQAGEDREPALGEWRRALQEERPALEFGPSGTAPLIMIVCGERGGLVLQRSGAPAPGASPMLSVTVGGQGRQLSVVSSGGSTPVQRTTLAPGDLLIQQLAVATAPIALRFGDGTQLLLPHSPMIGQFAQGCSTGFPRNAAAGASTAEGNGQAAAAAQPAAANEANGAAAR